MTRPVYPTALRKPRACLSVVRLEPGDEARLGDSAQKPRTLVRTEVINQIRRYEMAKSFSCHDLGTKCIWTAIADTQEDLMKKIIVHAAEEHDILEMNEAQVQRIRELMKDI
jgi:predicted small metal-binding protein